MDLYEDNNDDVKAGKYQESAAVWSEFVAKNGRKRCQSVNNEMLECGVSSSPKMAGKMYYSTVSYEQSDYCMYAHKFCDDQNPS